MTIYDIQQSYKTLYIIVQGMLGVLRSDIGLIASLLRDGNVSSASDLFAYQT